MSKLFKKTLLAMILLFGVIATVISGFAGWSLYDRIIDEYESKAVAIASNIAHSSMEIILNRDASTIQSIVDQYNEIKGLAYVLVVHHNGEVLSHTFAPHVPYELQKLIERPRERKEDVIVTKVRVGGFKDQPIMEDPLGNLLLRVLQWVRLKDQGNVLDVSSPILSGAAGYVHVGMHLDGVESYTWATILKLHLATFVIFVVAVVIAGMITNTISRPLAKLTEYSNKVANREFSAAIDIKSKDEIGILATTMTNMASEIQTRVTTLEQEVSDATQELEDTLAYVSAIIENLADGLLVMDSQGKVSRCNPALLHILELDYDPRGHSVRELLGSEAADFLQRKGSELAETFENIPIDSRIEEASNGFLRLDQRPDNTIEITAVEKNGRRFPIELVASAVCLKGIWHTIGIVRDITVRKRAEETLRLSEEKYRGIFEHAVAGIFQTDAGGFLINANPASARILGYESPEELLEAVKKVGAKIYLNPQRQEEFIRLMQEGQLLRGFEVELLRKDGTPIWASLHARPILNERGVLLSTEGILRDITERKRAQEALLESERRYRELFDISPDPMMVHKEGIILFGNDTAAKFLRVGPAEALEGLPILDFIHPDFRESVGHSINQAQQLRVASAFAEVQFLRANGSVGHLELVAVPTRYNNENAVLFLGRDITERKEAQDALRTSEERFRTIFEIAPDCIFLKDLDLRYTNVNPSVETLLGIPASEIVGKRAEDLFGAEAGRHVREGDIRVLAGETIEDEHTRPVRGMYLTFHDIRTPLRDSSGSVIGVCKFSRNITDRKGVQRPPVATERSYTSKAMLGALERARQAAETDGIVLLLGESGSGKDYMARWIHRKSQRADGPFFSVNCAAISRELAESEFFGHERGAFTGAVTRKKGLLELAEGGTLLLNEIGELPLHLQSKLLTFLDTRSFTRVGGEKDIRVNARLIAATHRDLELEVREGRFLEALFYRLNVYPVRVPPLRERLEDLPIMVEEILLNLATEMRLTQVPTIDPEDVRKLGSYTWPGNVRELRNFLERQAMLSKGGKLDSVLTSAPSATSRDWSHEIRFCDDNQSLTTIIDEVTRSFCREALRRSRGSKKEAATLLGISRQSLYRYIKSYDLESECETAPGESSVM
ncbi:MAG: PAS domain S-box protein [Desulfomonile tiedjei]|nr:PAS domain S-box protein [Desulfomonile tiedjei]